MEIDIEVGDLYLKLQQFGKQNPNDIYRVNRLVKMDENGRLVPSKEFIDTYARLYPAYGDRRFVDDVPLITIYHSYEKKHICNLNLEITSYKTETQSESHPTK